MSGAKIHETGRRINSFGFSNRSRASEQNKPAIPDCISINYPCSATELVQFNQSWNRYAQAKFGACGHCFEDDAYPVRYPPTPELDYVFDHYTEEQQKIVFSCMSKEHVRLLAEDKSMTSEMYGILLKMRLKMQ